MTEKSTDVYSEIDEELEFTDEQTQELLKLNEKEIQILILSELKKITSLLNQRKSKR
ncbi:hypothetical protein [Nitrosopumilus adriaticus]|uniref:Uncharacterized protein n=1 Tax=Nitrosopumilus adriaticus TaxID=1580092 RepID=A0A0D5C3P2_9ARCH|nr:hypothetical protein [Nitrosopumilus adriaticus]AJW71022.1 hypothetical protein NADRNF5_1336 [Nitrosopumilus adriaticus]